MVDSEFRTTGLSVQICLDQHGFDLEARRVPCARREDEKAARAKWFHALDRLDLARSRNDRHELLVMMSTGGKTRGGR